ncbi:nitroreductase/quinone reductase family protein [Asanoa sp. NPDC049573]|uniref:nitroreductase/quinone reductase family protein n=1 Tax=Asanoa sp. NPDC049573 TaxID=3155396 RepID=UPI003417956C
MPRSYDQRPYRPATGSTFHEGMATTSVRYQIKRWMYDGGRPNWLARAMNHVSALQFSTGVLAPRTWVTLEVPGRRTGKVVSVPIVVVELDDARYLVSMLGRSANWVRNASAAGGFVVLRRRRREQVRLVEVDVDRRAPILRRYLQLAPGARPHFPIDRHAPLAEFEAIAVDFPVFRIVDADRP